MNRTDVLRPYVETLLRDLLDLAPEEELARDEDGDYPVVAAESEFYVRLIRFDPALVCVCAPFMQDVAESPELFAALNEINASNFGSRVAWRNGTIYAVSELVAETLDREELAFAFTRVRSCVAENAEALVKRCGGDLTTERSGMKDEFDV